MFDQWFVILRGSSPIANLWKILKDRSCVTGDAVCTDSPPSWHAFWQTWNTRILCLPSKTLKDQASRRKEKVLKSSTSKFDPATWRLRSLLESSSFWPNGKGHWQRYCGNLALFLKETNCMMYCSCILSGAKKIQIPWNHVVVAFFLGGGCKHVLFSPLFGEMIQFDCHRQVFNCLVLILFKHWFWYNVVFFVHTPHFVTFQQSQCNPPVWLASCTKGMLVARYPPWN